MPTKGPPSRSVMALAASAGLTALIIVGSRILNTTTRPIGYTVASVVASARLCFVMRLATAPATRGLLEARLEVIPRPKEFACKHQQAQRRPSWRMAVQKFIFRRGFSRWSNASLSWGSDLGANYLSPRICWVHFELEGERVIELMSWFPWNVM